MSLLWRVCANPVNELTDNTRDADTILFNTCSVRQHAEDKIYNALGRLRNAKRDHPEKIIGVLGWILAHQAFELLPHF